MPHLDDAYALARWLSGNSTDAEDIVQEACLRALRGLDRYAGGNARAWLLAITRNAAFTWLAKNRSGTVMGVEDLEEVERREMARKLPVDGNPEAQLIAKSDAQQLEAAIAELPVPFRQALVLL